MRPLLITALLVFPLSVFATEPLLPLEGEWYLEFMIDVKDRRDLDGVYDFELNPETGKLTISPEDPPASGFPRLHVEADQNWLRIFMHEKLILEGEAGGAMFAGESFDKERNATVLNRMRRVVQGDNHIEVVLESNKEDGRGWTEEGRIRLRRMAGDSF